MRGGKTEIIGKDVTVREVMEEIEKDAPYYERSGGGVTLSGGEALCQPDFAAALLKACHDCGINTAIETTGYAKREVLDKVIPHVDYVLMDIKHIDSKITKPLRANPTSSYLKTQNI